jgi:hypothetical protein
MVYEPEQPSAGRSPDFAVTYTTSLTFMLEVTRLRTAATAENPLASPLELERLADAICGKLGQFLPQRSNVLIVGAETLHLTSSDLQIVMLRIQQRAEQNNAGFWQRYGFRDRADFFRYYQRVSEILVRGSQLRGTAPAVWTNPQAKHPLPSKVRTAFHRSQMVLS